MMAESAGDYRSEHLDFPVIGSDQLQQGEDPLAVDQIQGRSAQPRSATSLAR